jgi:hypothetical protein
MSCRVKHCRFSSTHVTAGHRCGTCGRFGHGQLECGSRHKISQLSAYLGERVSNSCTVPGCLRPWTHESCGHHCGTCGHRSDGTCCAPQSATSTVQCPVCKENNDVNHDDLAVAYTGADCVVCFETGPCVLFGTCRHCVVCASCVAKL